MKTTESGGPSGYDAGKKIKGRKRHMAVDTEGSPIVLQVHRADIQDRDGAPDVIVELLCKAPQGLQAVCRRWLCGTETA